MRTITEFLNYSNGSEKQVIFENVLENELLPELENIFRILGIFHNRIQTVKNIKRDIRTIKRFGSDIYSADTSYGTSFYIQNPKTLLKDQED